MCKKGEAWHTNAQRATTGRQKRVSCMKSQTFGGGGRVTSPSIAFTPGLFGCSSSCSASSFCSCSSPSSASCPSCKSAHKYDVRATPKEFSAYQPQRCSAIRASELLEEEGWCTLQAQRTYRATKSCHDTLGSFHDNLGAHSTLLRRSSKKAQVRLANCIAIHSKSAQRCEVVNPYLKQEAMKSLSKLAAEE